MKLVYFGSDVFLPCFDFFLKQHEILALYTYHHDEDYMVEEGITRKAGAAGIPVHYESIGAQEIRSFFLKEGCQLIYSAEYDRIIPVPEDLPCFRGVNLHSSLLPEGRSYYPIEAAMDRGLSRTGITMHALAPSVDSGAILAQRELEILPEMDSIDVYLGLSALARDMTEEVCRDFEAAWQNARPQGESREYWKRPISGHLTLTHQLSRGKAMEMFRRYNSLTQVRLSGRVYYVQAMNTGTASLPVPEWPLREHFWLYALRDGHVRLAVLPKKRADRK